MAEITKKACSSLEQQLSSFIELRAIELAGGEIVWNTLLEPTKDILKGVAAKEIEVQKREAELVDKFKEASLQEELMATRLRRVEEEKSRVEEEKSRVEEEKSRVEEEMAKFEKEKDFFRTEMFRIDRATPSIYDIDPTRSEILIEQTKEYKELGLKVTDKIFNNEITGTEGRKILDEKVEELKRLMDARRHKTKSVARKKIEKNYEKLMKKGWDKRDFDMDTVRHDDRELVTGDKYSVHIPSEKVFVEHAMTMKENIQNNIKEQEQQKKKKSNKDDVPRWEHYCMASISLSGKGHFYTKTSNTPVLTPDGDINPNFYPSLIDKVEKNLDKVDTYEENSSEVSCKQITMSYTISQWESIKNWYPDAPIKPFKTFNDFSVFLASNEDVNCEQQCVEYLIHVYKEVNGELPKDCVGKWDPTKKFEEMIPQKKVLTYIPTQGDIRYVKQFSDLMTSYHENANTDCKNTARIIKWNDHMAVITELRPIRRRTRVQYRKPLKINADNSDAIEIFVDIEAFNRESEDKYAEQIPYLVCWADNDEIRSVSGEGCMSDFVDEILTKYRDAEHITMYAWYGSGYDYQHIYPYLKAKCDYDVCKLRNNAIIYAEFVFNFEDEKEKKTLTIHLKDPYLFILTSLDKAAKAFGVINKGKFPHQIIKDWPDLDRILDYWVITRNELIEEYDKNRMNIYIREWEEFEKEPNHETVLQKATDYCIIDVLAMQQIWTKFSNLVKEQLGMGIGKNIFTLSQLSMKLMESSLPPCVWIYPPNRKDYDFMHNAIYGGRVIAKNGDYHEEILYADVVSLYPSAMKLLKHGYGRATKVEQIDWNKHGIYNVTLTHPAEKEPHNYMPFVPRRISTFPATCVPQVDNKSSEKKGKLYWGWFKQHRGTYHTYDLLIAKDLGYNIECHEGIEYKSVGHIFNEFIERLYSLKDEHSKCNCPEQPCLIRMVAKIALNGGGYGKFVQKPIDIDTYIVRRDVIAGECAKLKENSEGEIFFGGSLTKRPTFQHLDGEHYDKMIFENETEPYYATQVGISILSGSRYRLYNLCKEFPGMQVIYSDTDSIFVRKSTVDWELFKSRCGTKLGQLDDTIDSTAHGVIHHMLIGGPKMYAYEYRDNEGMTNIRLHCKGVPTSMLTLDQFEVLLEDEDRHLAYKFAIMRKRIVGVQNMNIVKLIKQT